MERKFKKKRSKQDEKMTPTLRRSFRSAAMSTDIEWRGW